MLLRTGTSGYSYKLWKGSFYPQDLKNERMLEYYSSRLAAVEINNTFYRMPSESVLAAWAEQTPESFRFVLKVSRRITHFKRLDDCGDELEYFLDTALTLGERLGGLLFQLPPNFKKDAERLGAFLEALPPLCRAAFEFRHPSWLDAETYGLLRGHRGATLCIAETEPGEWDEIPVTADWGYVRLRRDEYTDADVAAWAKRIAAQPWGEAFAFFKHEDGGEGPRLAELLASSF
jgi:uncharacterized protein YecE (DUF72 family)